MARERDCKQQSSWLQIPSKFIPTMGGFFLYAMRTQERTKAVPANSTVNSESTLEGSMYQQSMNINEKKNGLEEKVNNSNSLKIKANFRQNVQ